MHGETIKFAVPSIWINSLKFVEDRIFFFYNYLKYSFYCSLCRLLDSDAQGGRAFRPPFSSYAPAPNA